MVKETYAGTYWDQNDYESFINSSNEYGLDLNHIEVRYAIEKTILWLESKIWELQQ